jgi:hypothetical protein
MSPKQLERVKLELKRASYHLPRLLELFL